LLGDTEPHFWDCADTHIALNPSFKFRVDDIEAVHQELSPRLPSLQPVVHTVRGLDELVVMDPDGKLTMFGQAAAAG
jgi:hypothetical protein